MVRAHYGGQSHHFDLETIQQLAKELLDNYGDIKAFRQLQTAEPPLLDFQAEYYDTTAAEIAVVSLNRFKIGVNAFR